MVAEKRFHDLVAAWLAESFADVNHEVRIDLPEDAEGSYVVADYVAHTPFQSYVIEVEDTVHSLETGLGQALRFADLTGHAPVVVFPAEEWTLAKRRIWPVEVETV